MNAFSRRIRGSERIRRRCLPGCRVCSIAVKYGLTPGEIMVLCLLCNTQTCGRIAQVMGIKYCTEQTHIGSMLDKTGMGTRLELALWAVKVGLVQPVAGGS